MMDECFPAREPRRGALARSAEKRERCGGAGGGVEGRSSITRAMSSISRKATAARTSGKRRGSVRATHPMGGFDQEVYCAYFYAAFCAEEAKMDRTRPWLGFLRAYQNRPKRAEPLCELARYCRVRGSGRWLTFLRGRPRQCRIPATSKSAFSSMKRLRAGARWTSGRSPPHGPAGGGDEGSCASACCGLGIARPERGRVEAQFRARLLKARRAGDHRAGPLLYESSAPQPVPREASSRRDAFLCDGRLPDHGLRTGLVARP